MSDAQTKRERAEEIVYAIREHTYRPAHDAGWAFDIDHDEAVNLVQSAMKD